MSRLEYGCDLVHCDQAGQRALVPQFPQPGLEFLSCASLFIWPERNAKTYRIGGYRIGGYILRSPIGDGEPSPFPLTSKPPA